MLRKTNGNTTRTVSSRRAGTKPSTSWRRNQGCAEQARPSGVGMFGSGQWTIGRRALKLTGRLPPNNLDPNARHRCVRRAGLRAPSASTSRWAAMTTSKPPTCCGVQHGRDAPFCGRASPIVASARHMYGSRIVNVRASLVDLDIGMVFKPHTDLYPLNAIANHIVKTGRVNGLRWQAHDLQTRADRYRLLSRPENRWRKRPPAAPRPAIQPT